MQGNYPKYHLQSFRNLLLVTLFSVFSVAVFGQSEIILIHGGVKDTESMKKMEGVQVKVLQNGKELENVTTSGSGKYEFELPLGFNYIIQFSKQDFVTKKLELNTKGIPMEDLEGGFQMTVDMSLFAYIEGFDLSILDAPIGKASFDPVRNSVEFDYDYTGRMQQKIDAEFERLKKMAGEQEKLRKEFDELVKKGDQKVMEKKYAEAIDKYDAALRLFPKEEPVIAKRADAQAKLDAENAAANLEKKYNDLMANAKSNIKKESFDDAVSNLNEAIKLKPEAREPKDLLAEVEKKRAALQNKAKYDQLITAADKEFSNKNYAISIEKYQEAIAVIGTEQYPRERIKEAQRLIDEALSSAMAAEQKEKRYKELIDLGRKNIGSKEYQVALRNYEEAKTLKPGEKLPVDKIAEIEKILADLAAKEAADRANESANAEAERIDREYKALIASADKKFDGEQLEEAKTDYIAASQLKSAEKYPKSRIQRIDELLAEKSAANSNALAEEQRRKAEADRLAQEEADRLEREKREASMDAERQKKLEAEEAERERLAQEKARKEEEERRRNEAFANNANSSTEDEAERYYREAHENEQRAKGKTIEQIKQDRKDDITEYTADANQRRNENLEERDAVNEKLEVIYRDGELNRAGKVDDKAREKDRTQTTLQTFDANSQARRDDYKEEEYAKGESYSALAMNDLNRAERIDNVERDKQTYQSNNDSYISKSGAIRQDNEYEAERQKESNRNQANRGEDIRLNNASDKETEKAANSEYYRDVTGAADERLASNYEGAEDKKKQYRDISEGKEVLLETNEYNVKKEKENNSYFLSDRSEEADLRKSDKRSELFDKDKGKQKDYDEYILPPGAQDIEEGIEERSYEEGNKMVIERTVKRGNKVDIFRKVISKTGTYYFKNGRSITEVQWKRETLDVKD
jgi:hypothetical protein